MEKIIYMDHSATTKVKKEVIDEMLPYFDEFYGNPSSVYSIGRKSKSAIENARKKVAKAINSSSEEIYFTGGGSEADNFAIKGIVYANKDKGNHIITTSIEHHAVLNTCGFLEKEGFKVTYLNVDEYGMISLEDLKKAITDKTILVSIMFANNEIGTIEPIEEIGAICKEKGIYFHTDAVQAVGNIPIDVKKMNIDLLSLSAHKFYGPKGIGVLYIKKGTKITSLIHGGSQEMRKRAGTENIAGIVGLGKAIEIASSNIENNIIKITELRNRAIDEILRRIPYTRLNGHREKRLPGNINICFNFIEGESLLLLLDGMGICASSGSACTSGSLDPSHVLLAIGLPHEIAHGSLRLSLGEDNTEEEVEFVINSLEKIVKRLRDMSPLYEDFIKKGEFNYV